MNEFAYRITNQVYDWIINNNKSIELRLYNEKSNQIKIGDIIKFVVLNNERKSIEVKVNGLLIYNNINNMLDDIDINKIAPVNEGDLKKLLCDIFGEQLNNHNLIGIKFDVMRICNE